MIGKRYLIWTVFIALLSGCSPVVEENEGADDADGALSMLESVFEGQHDKLAIGLMMDSVLTLYNVELNKENYLKMGNMLVAKRMANEDRFLEMDILAHMSSVNSGQKGVSFEEQLSKSIRAMKSRTK